MDLSRVDLNLLVAFDVLVTERSVTKAANRMCIGQSAMSATLGRLRSLFNDAILIRQGREMVPTPVAEDLLESVREVLNLAAATLSRRVKFDPAVDSRSYSIVASDYVTFVLLRHLLAILSTEAPNLRINIRLITEDFADIFSRNQTDILLTIKDAFPLSRQLYSEDLFTDRYICAMDANHPDISNKITLSEFSNMPYVGTTIGNIESYIERELNRRGIHRCIESTTSPMLACFLLPGTRSISMVHERLAKEFESFLNIRLVEPPFNQVEITESIYWTSRNNEDPGHMWLRQRIIDLAKELCK